MLMLMLYFKMAALAISLRRDDFTTFALAPTGEPQL